MTYPRLWIATRKVLRTAFLKYVDKADIKELFDSSLERLLLSGAVVKRLDAREGKKIYLDLSGKARRSMKLHGLLEPSNPRLLDVTGVTDGGREP